MSLNSAAQTLPLHIAQSIVSYVIWNEDVGSDMDKIQITDSNRKDLLILMKVCHHWRSVALPLYYYLTNISIYIPGISDFNKYPADMFNLDKVSENKGQQHIQCLHVFLYSSALIKPEASIKALRDTVKQCGQLKRLRAVLLDFKDDVFNPQYTPSNLEDFTVVDDLEETCAKYARLLNELLPNKRQLAFKFFSYIGADSDYFLPTHKQMANYFHIILGENVSSFELYGFCIGEKLMDSLKTARLQRLSIYSHKDKSLYIDLIRHNSASLECLYLCSCPQRAISLMVLPPGDNGVLTYPRLKKLDVDYPRKEDITVYEQFESDPFPALEQFTCRGVLDNGALATLKMENSHIRKLDLRISRETMDLIVSNNIFTAGSYSALDSIRINIHPYVFIDKEKASRLIAMLLNLSPTTRHVHFNDFHMFDFDDAVFADIIQSVSLMTLNLSEMEFTMDQIVKLASKFKNLDKLTVTLKDYPNGRLKAPDNNEVQRWKDELEAYTSNVRTICIESTSFPNSRRGVEFVVLMASILQGVGRVAFKPYESGNKMRNPLKNVQYALKRPVYKNCEYVHKVDFCMDDSS